MPTASLVSLIQSLLGGLGRRAVESPKGLLLAVLIPCALLSAWVPFVTRDLGFTAMLEMDDPRVRELAEIDRQMNLAGMLTLLLEGDDEQKLEDAASAVAERLSSQDNIAYVVAEPPVDWLTDRAPWFVEREDFDAWVNAALQPGAIGATAQLLGRMKEGERSLGELLGKGQRLVFVQMAANPLNLELGASDFPDIQRETQEVLEPFGVEGRFAGMAAAAAQDQNHVLKTIGLLTPVSLFLVLCILRLAERRLKRLVLVGAAMMVALGATTGATGLVTGKLTAISGFFGIMVFGLGIDFALHLLVRLREELSTGLPLAEALPKTLSTTGVGVLVGALTTAGAFGMMALAPEPSAMHLGVSGGLGLVFCVLLMLTVLPAGLVLLGVAEDSDPPPELRFPLVDRLAAFSVRRPVLVLLCAVTVAGVALSGTSRFSWETDLEKVFTRDVPATEVGRAIQERFALGDEWLLLTDELGEARRVTHAFEQSPRFAAVDSFASVFPADIEERRSTLESRREEIEAAAASWRQLRDGRPMPMKMMLAPGAELAQWLVTALDAGPPSFADLPPILKRQWMAPDGRYLVRARTAERTMDGVEAKEQRLDAEAVHPRAASVVMFYELTMGADRPWVRGVGFGILLLVLVVLVFDLRKPSSVLMALMPVLFGSSVTLGTLCWMGVPFNVLTALTVPLLVGLGVDDGIHVLHRMREDPTGPPERAAAAVGQAIVLTTMTTCASFSVLLFSNHPGLESMALVCAIGLPACLLASVMVIPACATLIRRLG